LKLKGKVFVNEIFETFDKDGNKEISKDEFETVLRSLGFNFFPLSI
jgi:Ca2+-binding EF-hand superfamily protein